MTVDQWLSFLAEYLRPVPTPPGFTSREIVRRAIEFDGPPRIPYSFVEPQESDILELAVVTFGSLCIPNVPLEEMAFDEWGVGWRGSGRLWGHAEVYPLADLSALGGYRFPEVTPTERLPLLKALTEAGNRAGKYVVGADIIGSYERLRGLMGFDNLMMSMYTERQRFEDLLDKLTDMTVDLIHIYADLDGVHAFMTWEDWGLQTSLQIRPAQWREIFKPRYARIVEEAHKAGMHYLWHCCGQIMDIIADMIEIGVDVVQLDQPRLMGVERLASEFGGKICFWNPVDIQWSASAEVSVEEVRVEAKHMVEQFGRFRGGFIARQYGQPWDIGVTPEKHRATYEAFMESGCR
jgi:uroporphyrinogen decarboxylase